MDGRRGIDTAREDVLLNKSGGARRVLESEQGEGGCEGRFYF